MNKDIMKALGFENEVDKVEKSLCPFCKDAVKIEDFRNELSRKEFKISGICQKCQDDFFGKD
jgi:hypothetical protein